MSQVNKKSNSVSATNFIVICKVQGDLKECSEAVQQWLTKSLKEIKHAATDDGTGCQSSWRVIFDTQENWGDEEEQVVRGLVHLFWQGGGCMDENWLVYLKDEQPTMNQCVFSNCLFRIT